MIQRQLSALYESKIVPKNTPPEIVKCFLKVCIQKKLSPFTRQIYLCKKNFIYSGDEYYIQTGIDGMRTLAERTGLYAGMDEYVFNDSLTAHQWDALGEDHPHSCKAIIYKFVQEQRMPFASSILWAEYCPPGDTRGFWKQKPCVMLGKCANAVALRIAFPEAISGLYIEEEMEMSDIRKLRVDNAIAEAIKMMR